MKFERNLSWISEKKYLISLLRSAPDPNIPTNKIQGRNSIILTVQDSAFRSSIMLPGIWHLLSCGCPWQEFWSSTWLKQWQKCQLYLFLSPFFLWNPLCCLKESPALHLSIRRHAWLYTSLFPHHHSWYKENNSFMYKTVILWLYCSM